MPIINKILKNFRFFISFILFYIIITVLTLPFFFNLIIWDEKISSMLWNIFVSISIFGGLILFMLIQLLSFLIIKEIKNGKS